MYPSDLKYGKEHTWFKQEGDNRGRVGITHPYQEQLKTIVYVELPQVGDEVTRDGAFGVIESSKATTDLYSPVSGRVVGVNHSVKFEPGLINRDPYDRGWMLLIELSRPDELASLLSAQEYEALVAQQHEE
jgi:glycine cleavage system H protein